MKRIIFIHSPIQKFLVENLLDVGLISPQDLLVYHRNQEPILDRSNPTIRRKGYALNEPGFLCKLLQNQAENLELLLPHSLCIAYHLAQDWPQVKKVSFLEEGTGTVYALKDPAFTTSVKHKQLKFLERLALRCHGHVTHRQATQAIQQYNAMLTPFMQTNSDKLGHIYGLSHWQQDDVPYIAIRLTPGQPPSMERKVLVAIGREESYMDAYWPLLRQSITALASAGVSVYFKLHPSLETAKDMDRINKALGLQKDLRLYSPGNKELGIAIVDDGFLGAISCFSSFQVYAHLWSSEIQQPFPMLSLENLLSMNSFENKAMRLPDINLLSNIHLDYESWLHAIDQKMLQEECQRMAANTAPRSL